jgi:hypothetical protein
VKDEQSVDALIGAPEPGHVTFAMSAVSVTVGMARRQLWDDRWARCQRRLNRLREARDGVMLPNSVDFEDLVYATFGDIESLRDWAGQRPNSPEVFEGYWRASGRDSAWAHEASPLTIARGLCVVDKHAHANDPTVWPAWVHEVRVDTGMAAVIRYLRAELADDPDSTAGEWYNDDWISSLRKKGVQVETYEIDALDLAITCADVWADWAASRPTA